MTRHLPFIAMTAVAVVLLCALVARGETVWMDAAADVAPDASSFTMRERSTDAENNSASAVSIAKSLSNNKEVIVSSVVTPSAQPDCADGQCRVRARSGADTFRTSATSDGPTRPFKRRGLFRRILSR